MAVPSATDAAPRLGTAVRRARSIGFTRATAFALAREVGLPFLVTRALLLAVAIVSTATLPVSPWVPHEWALPMAGPAFDAFARWDGYHYLRIAAAGYPPSDAASAAFFPLYPMLVRAGGLLIGDVSLPTLEVIALIVSNVGVICAAILLIALARMDLPRRVASRASWYLFLFPTSFFLSAAYPESMFLALSLGAVLACWHDRWLAAGALGGLAALARPYGVLILVPLTVEAFMQWRDGARPWRAAVALAAVPAALVAYMAYLARLYGDPLAFLHAQADWHRTLVAPWQTFIDFFSAPITVNTGMHSAVDLAFAVATIAAVVASWWLLRPSYALYLTALVLVPLSTGSLGSLARFDVGFFPVFLVLALAGRRRSFDRVYLVVGAGLGGAFMALFAQWYWVA